MENQIYIRKAKAEVNFTVILNKTITDERLSMESLGVLISILSLPDDWVIRKNDLQERLRVGRRIIDKCFLELKDAGYLFEVEVVSEGTRFAGKGYIIYGESQEATDVQNVQREMQVSGVQNVHCPGVQNVHLLNKHNTTKETLYGKKFQKPSLAEVLSFAKDKHQFNDAQAQIFAEKFWNFYESKGWLVGKTPMKNWKSAVSGTWKEKADEIKSKEQAFTKSTEVKFNFK